MSLIISTSNGSVFWVFYDYCASYLIISVLLQSLFLLLYIFFQRFLKSQRGFSNASTGYTFYPLSINRVGFFLSINREKIGCFPQFLCVLISSYE